MIAFPEVSATTTTLPSGLTLILDPDPQAPVISVQAWVETGSIHEGNKMGAGISHLLEHMLFKGTSSYTTEELAQAVQGAGGQWNAYTSFDRTVYYIDGPSNSTETFVKVLSEMIFEPAFPEADFESERDVIRREIDMGLDNPDSVASKQLFSTIYQKDARRHPVIGHLDLFNALTYEDMVDYHKHRYAPENVFFVVSGDFDPKTITKQLSAASSKAPRGFSPPPIIPKEPTQVGPRSTTETFAIPISKLVLAWQTTDLSSPHAAALDVLATILGTGRSARLYRRLREERKLCQHIGAWSWLPPLGPGTFAVSAEVEPSGKEALEQAIIEELAIAATDISEQELDKARRMSLASQFKTLTTASGRASDLGSNWFETRDLNHTKNYLEAMQSLTANDIQQAITHWIKPETLTTCVLDPEESQVKVQKKKQRATKHEIETYTLDNGIDVIIRRDHRIPQINFCAGMLAGTPSEPKELAGINSLLASQLTKGTETRDAELIANTLDSLGATLGCAAGNNTLLAKSSILTPDAKEIFPLIGDILTSPTFPEQSLELERTVQITTLHEKMEDPLGLAFYELRKKMFAGTAYEISSIGTEKSLNAITPENLRTQLKRLINRNNMALGIFGDVDTDAILEQLNKTFGNVPEGPKFSADHSTFQKGTDTQLTLESKQQSVVALGYEGCSFDHEDRYALGLLLEHLTDMSGPLFTRIREELGLAYYVNGSSFQGFGTGMLTFYLGTSPDQRELAHTNLLQILNKISKEGLSKEALERTRTQSLASLALSNQSSGAMAQNAVVNHLLGLGANNSEKESDRIKAVTHQQCCEAAAKYLSADNLHTMIVN